MFVFPQLPGGYVGVVHETNIIIAKGEESGHDAKVKGSFLPED